MTTTFLIDFGDSRFLTTSSTGQWSNRLNWRAELLLTRHRHLVAGRRILDIASHDGRFSWAALTLGATHVIGVEGRSHLVENARTNLASLCVPSERYEFINADIFEFMPALAPAQVDVVLCFGFFYHTIRQVELLRELQRIRPALVLVDTNVHVDPADETRGVLALRAENSSEEHATVDRINLVGWPNRRFIEILFDAHGFDIRELGWHEIGIEDYRDGWRASFVAQRRG
ncbi:MAG: class I SAM-dependent methyltransferase [Chromatiales bacterium]